MSPVEGQAEPADSRPPMPASALHYKPVREKVREKEPGREAKEKVRKEVRKEAQENMRKEAREKMRVRRVVVMWRERLI